MKARKQRRDKIAQLISWGHWFTFFNILLVLAIGSLYIEAAEAPGSALGVIYMLLNWLGHFAFLPFMVFIILIFPFCLIVPYSRVLRGIATLVAALGIIALVADLLFYRQYGYHLNTYSLSQLAQDAEAVFAGASFLILLGLLLTFVVLLVFELALANIAWKRLERLQQKHWGASFSAVFVLCFLASHSIHVWADAVLYTPITKQDDTFPLSYPTTAKTLMSKHGLLVEERSKATDRLLRETTTIDLAYPSAALQCARVNHSQSTLVVAYTALNTEALQRMQRQVPTLTQLTLPMVGQIDAASGAFELLYGLPDLYVKAISEADVAPAYLAPLHDYDIAWTVNSFAADALLPQPLREQGGHISIREPRAYFAMALVDASDSIAWHRSMRLLQQASADDMRIVVVALTPANQSDKSLSYRMDRMQVPILSNHALAWRQPFASLSDIVPSLLPAYLHCAGESDYFSTGENLADKARRWPLLMTFGEDIVIYQEEMTTVIDRQGESSSFSPDTFAPLPGISPSTPILIDGLRKLKRFNANSENNR